MTFPDLPPKNAPMAMLRTLHCQSGPTLYRILNRPRRWAFETDPSTGDCRLRIPPSKFRTWGRFISWFLFPGLTIALFWAQVTRDNMDEKAFFFTGGCIMALTSLAVGVGYIIHHIKERQQEANQIYTWIKQTNTLHLPGKETIGLDSLQQLFAQVIQSRSFEWHVNNTGPEGHPRYLEYNLIHQQQGQWERVPVLSAASTVHNRKAVVAFVKHMALPMLHTVVVGPDNLFRKKTTLETLSFTHKVWHPEQPKETDTAKPAAQTMGEDTAVTTASDAAFPHPDVPLPMRRQIHPDLLPTTKDNTNDATQDVLGLSWQCVTSLKGDTFLKPAMSRSYWWMAWFVVGGTICLLPVAMVVFGLFLQDFFHPFIWGMAGVTVFGDAILAATFFVAAARHDKTAPLVTIEKPKGVPELKLADGRTVDLDNASTSDRFIQCIQAHKPLSFTEDVAHHDTDPHPLVQLNLLEKRGGIWERMPLATATANRENRKAFAAFARALGLPLLETHMPHPGDWAIKQRPVEELLPIDETWTPESQVLNSDVALDQHRWVTQKL